LGRSAACSSWSALRLPRLPRSAAWASRWSCWSVRCLPGLPRMARFARDPGEPVLAVYAVFAVLLGTLWLVFAVWLGEFAGCCTRCSGSTRWVKPRLPRGHCWVALLVGSWLRWHPCLRSGRSSWSSASWVVRCCLWLGICCESGVKE
jgi:hypothetical protein